MFVDVGLNSLGSQREPGEESDDHRGIGRQDNSEADPSGCEFGGGQHGNQFGNPQH